MKRIWAFGIALLMAATFAPALSAGEHASAEAKAAFQRVEANAYDVRDDAARLRTLVRFPTLTSWKVHADELARVKVSVNNIADLLGDLKTHKDGMNERHAKAVNYIVADAAELSDRVTKAIQIVNDQKEKIEIGHPDYDKQLDAMYNHADRIVAAVGLTESSEELWEAREELSSSL